MVYIGIYIQDNSIILIILYESFSYGFIFNRLNTLWLATGMKTCLLLGIQTNFPQDTRRQAAE